jgi:hypothetical protein
MRMGRILLLFAGVLTVVTVAAIGANSLGSHEPSCSRDAEESRPLDLRAPQDRSHLQQDLAQIDAAALAFREAVARRPLLSDSVDAVEGARTAPDRARNWCRDTLRSELLRTHHLQPGDLQPWQ